MKVIFAHDHKFLLIDEEYYTSGGLPDEVLSRYVDYYGELDVIARVIPKEEKNPSLKKIINPKVKIHACLKRGEIKKKIKKADIVIARLPSIKGIQAIYYAKRYNKPYVVELVGDPWSSLWFYGSLKGKLVAPIATLVTKSVVKRSKYVIYVSRHFLQEKYPTKGFNVGCPDVVLDEPQIDVLNKRLNWIKESKNRKEWVFGLIGSLNVNYRGHETVIKALYELKNRGFDCKVKFLGSGNKEKWVEIAKKYQIEDKIEFYGVLPSGKPVLEWIDGIDILTMPTQQETLGRAIIEAMSRGCPVVGSIETAIGEQIGSDCLFKAQDYIALANITESMITDNDYMMYCAYENFYRSFKYINKQTDKIRNNFYNTFAINQSSLVNQNNQKETKNSTDL